MKEEAFVESVQDVGIDPSCPETAAVSAQMEQGVASILNRLLVLLMIAILLTLSLPAILLLFGRGRAPASVPVPDPIIRTRTLPSDPTEDFV